MVEGDPVYLQPTAMIDSQHPDIVAYAARVTAGAGVDAGNLAVCLHDAVRDDIRYDPYYPFYRPEHYRASRVLAAGRGYCVPKAVLLCALGRACGIPSRLGFATVRNHLATRQLIAFLGSDLFVYHGFTEFYLQNRWIKATPAFNRELCRRHGVAPLAFNGRDDSIFQAYNQKREKFMEYIAYHGSHADVPLDDLLAAWRQAYGRERVDGWIEALEKAGGRSNRDFATEDILS